MVSDLANGLDDLIHVAPRAEQHVLHKPDGLPAQLVVLGAFVAQGPPSTAAFP